LSFLRLIRFPNLLIVILTQYLLEYLVLRPAIQDSSNSPLLDHFHFALLVFSTVIIAAGGYIINDIYDYKIDLINKPDQLIINKKISSKNAWIIYWSISIFGFLISLYLAFYVKNLPLVLIYPIAILLLFLYSKSLKKSVLVGNLIVALFCAFVPGIVLFAERETLMPSSEYKEYCLTSELISNPAIQSFFFYILFAFISTLYREVIKDIEDVEGDKKNGCKTLPVFSIWH